MSQLARTAATHFAGQLVTAMSPVEIMAAMVLENPAYDVVARRFAGMGAALIAGVSAWLGWLRKCIPTAPGSLPKPRPCPHLVNRPDPGLPACTPGRRKGLTWLHVLAHISTIGWQNHPLTTRMSGLTRLPVPAHTYVYAPSARPPLADRHSRAPHHHTTTQAPTLDALRLSPAGVIRLVTPSSASWMLGMDTFASANALTTQATRFAVVHGVHVDGPLAPEPGAPGGEFLVIRRAIFAPASGPNDTFGQPDAINPSCGAPCAYNASSGTRFWGFVSSCGGSACPRMCPYRQTASYC